MKYCKTLEEFVTRFDKEVTIIIAKKFSRLLKFYRLEDIKGDLYLHFQKKKYIEKFRPLEIHIDDENKIWEIYPNKAKFSTYIFRGLLNYIYAYYKKIDPNFNCISLQDYKDDTGFVKDSESGSSTVYKVVLKDVSYENLDNKIFLDNIRDYLKNNFNKGTIIGDSDTSTTVLRAINKYGKEGCTKNDIMSVVKDNKISNTLKEIESKGLINISLIKDGSMRYKLNDSKIEKRSLYHLMDLYMKGFSDREISEKFQMTIAGVGILKRLLRKKIKFYTNSSSIYKYFKYRSKK